MAGRYTERDEEDDDQDVEASCAACGETMRRRCSSGQPRQHIARFARQHTHVDPLEKPPQTR